MVCVVAWNPIIFKDKGVVWCGVETGEHRAPWISASVFDPLCLSGGRFALTPSGSGDKLLKKKKKKISTNNAALPVIFLHVYLLSSFSFLFAALEGRQLISLHQ